jgi:hypothetical protein
MLDTALDLIQATVQLEQPAEHGRTVGTGFLISAWNADGTPQTVLVTANHVFQDMKGERVRVGYRTAGANGGWSYTPRWLKIRNEDGSALWTAHPERDVAAITIKAPPEFARAAIPLNYLATEQDFDDQQIRPGDELLILGFPNGLSANDAGFPILRSGRVASYPVSPAVSPTFLLDFAVFPGNSGGPVFTTRAMRRVSSSAARPLIAGLLTQQVEYNNQRLEIGVVTHARYIAETIELLEGGRWPGPPPVRAVPSPVVKPVSATPVACVAPTTPWGWVKGEFADLQRAIVRTWRTLTAWVASPPATHSGPDRQVA